MTNRPNKIVWQRYLETLNRLERASSRIIEIGDKEDPSWAELELVKSLFAEYSEAEKSIAEIMQDGRAEFRSLRARLQSREQDTRPDQSQSG